MSIPLASLVPYRATRERLLPAGVRHGPRPASVSAIEAAVLHSNAGAADLAGENWLFNAGALGNYHLFIWKDGSTTRIVPDRLRAWHAGVSMLGTRSNMNDWSLGWSFAHKNDGIQPITNEQYVTVAQIAVHYIRQGLRLESITSHAAVREAARVDARRRGVSEKNLPAVKTDPRNFDWDRFRADVSALLSPASSPTQGVGPKPGERRWSDFFGEPIILTRYAGEHDWSFVRQSEIQKLGTRGNVPWSRMAKEKP